MKKILSFLAITLFLFSPIAFAEIQNYEEDIESGVEVDAPNLIELNDNWHVGVEAKKQLNQTNSNEGYSVYGKVTYSGIWFDLNGDK